MNSFTVTQSARLLPFLFARMPERSRTAVKALLSRRQVSVDREVVTQFDYPLAVGQQVAIQDAGAAGQEGAGSGRRLTLLFEDDAIVVVEKRAGLLSMSDGVPGRMCAYGLLSEHVKKSDPQAKVFIVHRLDRETSGLLMFARSRTVQEQLQKVWEETVLERKYVAVAEGGMEQEEGTIISWLTENKALIVKSSPRPNDGQKAVTHYRVLKANRRYSLVELSLETGRKNQIRVHLQDLGHSVIGDLKYGATQDPIHRMALHARVLAFRHPLTGEAKRFETPIPEEFLRLFP